MTVAPWIKLNDGHAIPQVGLGTWPLDDDQAATAVVQALEAGYRHVDTAVKYGNERGVGNGIRASGVDRGEVFVTTKLDGQFQGNDRAVEGLEGSLKRLGLGYVDLLLIHWPLPARDDYVSTWKTFERLQAEGKVRSIGVSNFKPAHLQRLMAETEVVPAVNQIQLTPAVTRAAERQFHEEHGIATESYSPLGGAGAGLLSAPILSQLAEKHGKNTRPAGPSLACSKRNCNDSENGQSGQDEGKPGHLRFRLGSAGSSGIIGPGRRSRCGQ